MSFLRPLLVAAVIAAIAAAGGAAAEDAPAPAGLFLTGLGDVPLMPGLEELPALGVSFDKPGGRIVVAYAEGRVERGTVIAFYRASLPQLGWQAAGPASFRREGELLRLEFVEGEAILTVRFFLSPD